MRKACARLEVPSHADPVDSRPRPRMHTSTYAHCTPHGAHIDDIVTLTQTAQPRCHTAAIPQRTHTSLVAHTRKKKTRTRLDPTAAHAPLGDHRSISRDLQLSSWSMCSTLAWRHRASMPSDARSDCSELKCSSVEATCPSVDTRRRHCLAFWSSVGVRFARCEYFSRLCNGLQDLVPEFCSPCLDRRLYLEPRVL